jgi:hypothetical protein
MLAADMAELRILAAGIGGDKNSSVRYGGAENSFGRYGGAENSSGRYWQS